MHPAWVDIGVHTLAAEAHAEKMANRGGKNFL